jgi:hypothetical protein
MTTLPSETVSIDAQLSVPEVLRRLRAEAEDWHESKLAPEARRSGVTGYRLRIDPQRGASARLWTKPKATVVCDLALHPTAGGVRCVGVLRLRHPLSVGMGVWAALAVVTTLGGSAGALAPWPGIGLAVDAVVASAVSLACLLGLGYGLLRLWWHMGRFQRAELKRLLLRVTANPAEPLRFDA